jgi:tetratricopeptide (TPR) repeat protein
MPPNVSSWLLLAARVVAVSSGCVLAANALAQDVPGCGSLRNGYGPYDYRSAEARSLRLPVVEQYHFSNDVAMLSRGAQALGDLDYTLRAFPNHARALQTVAKWALQGGRFPNPEIPSADCYFQRAMAFAADDPAVRVIYANFLFRSGHIDAARPQYEEALRLAPDSPEVNYDAGLLFVKLGDLPRAKQLAQKAYDSGYPLPGLRRQIAAAEAAGAHPRAAQDK